MGRRRGGGFGSGGCSVSNPPIALGAWLGCSEAGQGWTSSGASATSSTATAPAAARRTSRDEEQTAHVHAQQTGGQRGQHGTGGTQGEQGARAVGEEAASGLGALGGSGLEHSSPILLTRAHPCSSPARAEGRTGRHTHTYPPHLTSIPRHSTNLNTLSIIMPWYLIYFIFLLTFPYCTFDVQSQL